MLPDYFICCHATYECSCDERFDRTFLHKREKLLIVLGKNEGFILEVQKYRLKAFENFV